MINYNVLYTFKISKKVDLILSALMTKGKKKTKGAGGNFQR